MSYVDRDWSEMMFDLIRRGRTRFWIARSIGVSEPTVRTYMAGAKPSHWRGELILKTWARETGKAREDAPMVPVAVRDAVAGRRAGV